MRTCCLCNNQASEDGAILTISGFGNPRILCAECENDMDKLKLGKDVSEIEAAMDRIATKLTLADSGDLSVINATNEVLLLANERLEKIKSGEYDFSLDESEEEEYEIPEDMLESEEDKELDRQDEEKNKKLDFVINIVFGVVVAAIIGYTILNLIF